MCFWLLESVFRASYSEYDGCGITYLGVISPRKLFPQNDGFGMRPPRTLSKLVILIVASSVVGDDLRVVGIGCRVGIVPAHVITNGRRRRSGVVISGIGVRRMLFVSGIIRWIGMRGSNRSGR
jgi:hypothetical protein